MRTLRSLTLASVVVLVAAGAWADPPLPASMPVCVQGDGPLLRAGTAVPMRAGMSDPSRAPSDDELNWLVRETGRCVTSPRRARERAVCGTTPTPRPVVRPTLCQQ